MSEVVFKILNNINDFFIHLIGINWRLICVIYLILTPIVAVIWFLNLVNLLEKLKNNKNPHNQKILGAVWSFVFTMLLIISFTVIH